MQNRNTLAPPLPKPDVTIRLDHDAEVVPGLRVADQDPQSRGADFPGAVGRRGELPAVGAVAWWKRVRIRAGEFDGGAGGGAGMGGRNPGGAEKAVGMSWRFPLCGIVLMINLDRKN